FRSSCSFCLDGQSFQTQSLSRKRQDLIVIEGQWRRRAERVPRNLARVVSRIGRRRLLANPAEVDHTNCSATRITLGIAEGVKLLEFPDLQSRLLLQFAPATRFERFVLVEETTG